MVRTQSKKRCSQKDYDKITKRMPTLTTQELRALVKKRTAKSRPRKVATFMDPILKTQKAQSFAKNLEKEHFKCAICLEPFAHPFQLPCRHIFCYMCLDKMSRACSKINICPLCRSEMGQENPVRAFQLHSLLKGLLCKLESSERDHYMDRMREVQQQFERRNRAIRELRANQQIGYKVGNRWREGSVLRVFRENNKEKVAVKSMNGARQFIFGSTSCHLDDVGAVTANLPPPKRFQFNNYSLTSFSRQDPQVFIDEIRIDYSQNADGEPDRMLLLAFSSLPFSSLQVTQNQNSFP